VHDLEAGARYRTPSVDLQANIYSMDFRNEIAPIGQLSYLGSPLRQNVKSSYRRGIEGDITVRATHRLTIGGNIATSTNRIREYTDSSGDAPVTYHNVEPLLTPRLLSAARAAFLVAGGVSVALEGRHQSRSFLQNTSDPRLTLPASSNLDASLSWQLGNYELVARGNNLLDSKAYGSGYASGGVSYYFVVPPRNFFVTLRASF
jgi:iron complex outermembrane receptor protein